MSLVPAGRGKSTRTATGPCPASDKRPQADRPITTKPVICVVAGALFDRDRRVLIAQRPAGKHMAGRWEFPGGKMAQGESETEALVRELREELGITVAAGACRPFMRLSHEYEDRIVELSMWVVDGYLGEPVGLDGQALNWVPLGELQDEDILEADSPFVLGLQEEEARSR